MCSLTPYFVFGFPGGLGLLGLGMQRGNRERETRHRGRLGPLGLGQRRGKAGGQSSHPISQVHVWGHSKGAWWGSLFLATRPRLFASALLSGGYCSPNLSLLGLSCLVLSACVCSSVGIFAGACMHWLLAFVPLWHGPHACLCLRLCLHVCSNRSCGSGDGDRHQLCHCHHHRCHLCQRRHLFHHIHVLSYHRHRSSPFICHHRASVEIASHRYAYELVKAECHAQRGCLCGSSHRERVPRLLGGLQHRQLLPVPRVLPVLHGVAQSGGRHQ